jgi:asparagine synthase (glutamine-hydrolysing)
MSGIAGIFAYHGEAPPIETEELVDIRDAMAARGPDGSGMWIDASRRIGLTHRRLAIMDSTEASAQPMRAQDELCVITFDGAIYNFRELKIELEKLGHQFRTRSDTEVLLALYREHGHEMVHELRGMYAFAIWDVQKQQLFLARDPFGIKPLYYSNDGKTVRFASQVKALLKGNGVRFTPEPAGHTGFFIFGYVPEPYTLYRQIRALPAGSTLTFSYDCSPVVERFFDIAQRLVQAQSSPIVLNYREQMDLIESALKDSVAHHQVADVPVGVLLSSRLESSVVAYQASRTGGALVRTVTLGFDELAGSKFDEVPLAEACANRLGASHSTHRINRKVFLENLPQVLEAMDQPSVGGIKAWFAARAAAEEGIKACLSGVGGEELFGGDIGSLPVARMVRERSALGSLKPANTTSDMYLLHRSLCAASELEPLLDRKFLAEGLRELDAGNRIRQSVKGIESPHASIVSLELGWHMRSQRLREVDWAGMSHGLEVRLPFVDVPFFDSLSATLVSNRPPTKDVLAACTGSDRVPVFKEGSNKKFGSPIHRWLEPGNVFFRRGRSLRNWSRAVYGQFVQEFFLSASMPLPPKLVGSQPILLYRIGQLGDTLVSLPGIQALRKQYPNRKIVLLTNHHPERGALVSAWDVIGPTGLLDGVIHYPVVSGRWRNFLTYLRLVRKIRTLAPAEVVNLTPRGNERAAQRDRSFFQNLCGVPAYRAMKPAPLGAHGAVPPLPSVQPEWQRLLQVVDPVATDFNYRLRLPRWAEIEAQKALLRFTGTATRFVGIGPGSKMPAKRWATARFCEVGRHILSECQEAVLVVLGGTEDIEVGEELCHTWGPRSINLAGKVSIFGAAAVLARCLSYVGNDTGTMHIAASMGTPCVALFSARDFPGKWDPYGAQHAILRRNVECAGCMLEVCNRNNYCLDLISTSDVLQSWRSVARSVNATRASTVNA